MNAAQHTRHMTPPRERGALPLADCDFLAGLRQARQAFRRGDELPAMDELFPLIGKQASEMETAP
jgi:hypothetical protein